MNWNSHVLKSYCFSIYLIIHIFIFISMDISKIYKELTQLNIENKQLD